MNAVEIEEAVSDLVIQPFDHAEFLISLNSLDCVFFYWYA